MKGKDLYTKIVLTIIAVSLVVLVIQNFFQADSVSAEAQLSSGEVIDVNIAQIDGHPVVLNEGGSHSETTRVNIEEIDGWGVNIREK
ncbi:MAG: hypothetical protein OEW69_12050 [Nitrospirota bacterium]|nr:hypothetical protein [Nitrospirota bacterium]